MKTCRSPLVAAWLALSLASWCSAPARGQNAADLQASINKAQELDRQRKPKEAIAAWEKALDQATALLGEDHDATATIINGLAGALADQREFDRAEKLYRRSLAIAERTKGAESLLAAQVLSNFAEMYRVQNKLDKAEELFLRSIKAWKAQTGVPHPHFGVTMMNLAVLYNNQGKFDKAGPLYRRSLKILEESKGVEPDQLAAIYNNVAVMYQNQGKLAHAAPLFQRSLDIMALHLRADHPNLAKARASLAGIYMEQGQYAKAAPLYEQSLKVLEAELGPSDPVVSTCTNNLVLLFRGLGQLDKALSYSERSEKLQEGQTGADPVNLANVLLNRASIHALRKEYDKADELAQKALAILEKKLGDHPYTAICLGQLGLNARFQGRFDQAETYFLRKLKILTDPNDPDTIHVATTLRELAGLYREQGKLDKAEPLLERSLTIRRKQWGDNHPETAESASDLALLCEATGRTARAAQLFDQARRGIRVFTARELPALPEESQAAFLNIHDADYWQKALSLGLAHPKEEALREQSATWVLNGKAVALQALAESALLARDLPRPVIGDLTRQLLELRKKLSRLTFARPKVGEEAALAKERKELAEQEQELAKKLRAQGSPLLPENPWVELAELRRHLPKGAVFVDLVRFTPFDLTIKSGIPLYHSARYAAWITPAEGPVQLVELDEAEAIDNAVAAVRKRLGQDAGALGQRREAAAEKALREPLDALAKLVLHPLLPHLEKAESWIICPDAALWLVPWAALPLPDGAYAIEKYPIRHVLSGRHLLPPPERAALDRRPPLLLADPDFDLDPEGVAAVTNQLLRDQQAPAAGDRRSSQLALGRIRRLPGTAAEARGITPSVQTYTGMEPLVYLQKKAVAGALLAVRNPRLVVFSTHGFFLEDQGGAFVPPPPGGNRGFEPEEPINAPPTPPPAARRTGARVWENPLLRCGLLLAGCNQPDESGQRGGQGVLTGLEILSSDLRGCDLVVLSACETGLGEVRNGEGVASLRQAFQLAGAEAVIATLWQIPDRESAELMSDFFGNLAGGQSKSEALRKAQKKMIQTRREQNGAAHPVYWAAYTLTGN